MDAFNANVASIEEQSIHFIDDAFQKLRSAEGAFELVENFQNVQSRDVGSRRPVVCIRRGRGWFLCRV